MYCFIGNQYFSTHIAMAEDEDKPISLDDIRSSDKSKLAHTYKL